MELTFDQIEDYLDCIFTGRKFTTVSKSKEDVWIEFRHPSSLDKMKASFEYKKSYALALKSGMLSDKDLNELMESRGIFTKADQELIESLKSKRHAQEVVLSKTTKVERHIERVKGIIDDFTSQINKLLYKKHSVMMQSADYKAEEDKTSYLCWCSTFNEDGRHFWEDYNSFKNELDIEFKNKVTIEFIRFYNGLEIGVIRYLARNNLWRIRYVNSMKTSESLFGVPTAEYNRDMLHLVYWSNYYQNIYEMLPEDRPQDDVINDDEALDAYMTSYYDEREKDSLSRKEGKKQGRLSAMNKEEVILTRSHELYQKVKFDKPKEAQRAPKQRADIVARKQRNKARRPPKRR